MMAWRRRELIRKDAIVAADAIHYAAMMLEAWRRGAATLPGDVRERVQDARVAIHFHEDFYSKNSKAKFPEITQELKDALGELEAAIYTHEKGETRMVQPMKVQVKRAILVQWLHEEKTRRTLDGKGRQDASFSGIIEGLILQEIDRRKDLCLEEAPK